MVQGLDIDGDLQMQLLVIQSNLNVRPGRGGFLPRCLWLLALDTQLVNSVGSESPNEAEQRDLVASAPQLRGVGTQ